MPIKASDINKLMEAESQRAEEAQVIQQFRMPSAADWGHTVGIVQAEGARMQREAEARNLAIQQAEELRRVREELQRTREESKVDSRKTRLFIWWGIVATLLAGVLPVLVGWLLTR